MILFRCLLLIALLLGLPRAASAGGAVILRDEETEQALKMMTAPIFQQAGLAPGAVRFVLVDSTEMNAFVAGGQNIFLYSGLILKTENPEELLGVIAHETGHIADGHLFRGRIENAHLSMEAILGSLLGIAAGAVSGNMDVGMAAVSASSSLGLRQMLRHTRTQEGSADRAGVRFLEGAGLPVSGFLSFMKKLGAQELIPDSEQSEYVQTHPLTQDRIDSLQRAVEEGPPGHIAPQWAEVHRRFKSKLYGYLFPDRALAEADDKIAGRYGRAVAWLRKGHPDKALAEIDLLLKIEPDNAYFNELRGQILFDAGRIEDALGAYARALALAPNANLIRIAYAQVLLESRKDVDVRTDAAIRELTLALKTEGDNPEPYHLLGIAYGKKGQDGLSRLSLAETALLQGRRDFARREALLAKAALKPGAPGYQRALDILEISAKEGDKGGRDD